MIEDFIKLGKWEGLGPLCRGSGSRWEEGECGHGALPPKRPHVTEGDLKTRGGDTMTLTVEPGTGRWLRTTFPGLCFYAIKL